MSNPYRQLATMPQMRLHLEPIVIPWWPIGASAVWCLGSASVPMLLLIPAWYPRCPLWALYWFVTHLACAILAFPVGVALWRRGWERW